MDVIKKSFNEECVTVNLKPYVYLKAICSGKLTNVRREIQRDAISYHLFQKEKKTVFMKIKKKKLQKKSQVWYNMNYFIFFILFY